MIGCNQRKNGSNHRLILPSKERQFLLVQRDAGDRDVDNGIVFALHKGITKKPRYSTIFKFGLIFEGCSTKVLVSAAFSVVAVGSRDLGLIIRQICIEVSDKDTYSI